MLRGTLNTKFLLAFGLISAALTGAMLYLVGQRIEARVREEMTSSLWRSLDTFRGLQQQRETTLERSAALLAGLPPVMAVMTSEDPATIQDATRGFWELSGSQLLVMATPRGEVVALHSTAAGLQRPEMARALQRSLAATKTRDWWFSGGHLFQIFLQPIRFGAAPDSPELGVLAVGFEVDRQVAQDIARVAGGHVAFHYDSQLAVTTLPRELQAGLQRQAAAIPADHHAKELSLAGEEYLASSLVLSPGPPPVTLTALDSYSESRQFLHNLNRWIVAVGLLGVILGSVLVFLVSTSITRPLYQLVEGVRALEKGDFEYPLRVQGNDEVAALTKAFKVMRGRLEESQRQRVAAERLATIGRMATTISHDLRHPLTSILAYAEFLADSRLTDDQRKDFFGEISLAVHRMIDELNSLLGFSKQGEEIQAVPARLEDVIERALQAVRILPEFEDISVRYRPTGSCDGVFDPGKMERVLVNLVVNACEAVARPGGAVEVASRRDGADLEASVKDNGPGIPEAIRPVLFQPFVSHGKEQGIGLGLTVVQKIVRDHGGTVRVDTGATGTTIVIRIPASPPGREPQPSAPAVETGTTGTK